MDTATFEIVRGIVQMGFEGALAVGLLVVWRAYRKEADDHKATLRDFIDKQINNLNARLMMLEDRMTLVDRIASGKANGNGFFDGPPRDTVKRADLHSIDE